MSNHCTSNHLKCPLLNLYLDNLAIIHPGLGGNDVVHNFGSTKRSVLLGSSTLPWFCVQQPFSIVHHLPQSKHCKMENGILYFLVFSSNDSLALKSLSNHFQFTFSTNSLSICLLHFLHTCVIVDCIFFYFPSKDLQKYQSFHKEIGECLCNSGKTIGFHC